MAAKSNGLTTHSNTASLNQQFLDLGTRDHQLLVERARCFHDKHFEGNQLEQMRRTIKCLDNLLDSGDTEIARLKKEKKESSGLLASKHTKIARLENENEELSERVKDLKFENVVLKVASAAVIAAVMLH